MQELAIVGQIGEVGEILVVRDWVTGRHAERGAGLRVDNSLEVAAVQVYAAALDATSPGWARRFPPAMTSERSTTTSVRARYGLSAKQLRNIRNAATSGALEHKAAEHS